MNPIYSTIKKLLTKHKNQENTKDHIVPCFFAADKNIKPLKVVSSLYGQLYFSKDPKASPLIMMLYVPDAHTRFTKHDKEKYTLQLTKKHIKNIRLIDAQKKTIAVKIKGDFYDLLWNRYIGSLEKKPFPGYLMLRPINTKYHEEFDIILKRLKLIK